MSLHPVRQLADISQLTGIKAVREQSRERERHVAARQLDTARQTLQSRIEVRLSRDEARARQERVIYDDLCSRVVTLSDIQLAHHQVDCMKRDAQQDLEQQQAAERQRDQAAEHARAAQKALQSARTDRTKTEALWGDVRSQAERRLTAAEDASFDDICELMDASRRARHATEDGTP